MGTTSRDIFVMIKSMVKVLIVPQKGKKLEELGGATD
jgi:hypothetical protein